MTGLLHDGQFSGTVHDGLGGESGTQATPGKIMRIQPMRAVARLTR